MRVEKVFSVFNNTKYTLSKIYIIHESSVFQCQTEKEYFNLNALEITPKASIFYEVGDFSILDD